MCRGKKYCSELNDDFTKWDNNCPLRQPSWMLTQIDIFCNAVLLYKDDNLEECKNLLSTIRSKEIQDWYIEHGQMSGIHRKNSLNIPKPESIDDHLRDPIRSPKKYQNEVFNRDGYKCRYCGIKLISQKFMKNFISNLQWIHFQKGSRNRDRHGIIHLTWPVADHVIPWNIGGRTNMDNLVSSCPACNYGKYNFTVEQLGLSNPFDRQPIIDDWKGLQEFDLQT